MHACACAREKSCCYFPGLFNGVVSIVEVSRVKLSNKMCTYEESEGKAEKVIIDSLTVLYLQQLWAHLDKSFKGEVSNWVSSDYKLDPLTQVPLSR